MRLGGLEHAQERVFLLSLTHGAETHSLAAAMEVIRIYKPEPVIEMMWRAGERLERGVRKSIGEHSLQKHFKVLGKPCCQVYATLDSEKNPSQAHFLWVTGFLGLNLFQSAFTGICPLVNILHKLGVKDGPASCN